MLSEKNSSSDSSKQWFVLIDDRYRGPYSENQIRSAIEQGGLAGANLVWKEGMLDWEALARVVEFQDNDPSVTADVDLSQSALSFLDYLEPEEDWTGSPPKSPGVALPLTPPDSQTVPPLAFNSDFWMAESKLEVSKWGKPYVRLVAIFAGTALLSLALWQFNRSGFPALKDLTAREAKELRAITEDDPSLGDSAAAALVPMNLREPRFYIASNAKNGTGLQARLEGLRDSMVDSFYYDTSVNLIVKNNFAKTPAFVQAGGQPLAPGDYTLTILKEGVPLTQKTFFLGGTKNSEYQEKLKIYQGKLRIQAESELAEVRQVTELLERQFAETNSRFKSSNGWSKFHPQWLALQSQIEILFQEVNSELLMKEFYHGSLYGLLKEATTEISRLHNEQNSAISLGAIDRSKIADLSRSAQSRLLTLRAKVMQAERQTGI